MNTPASPHEPHGGHGDEPERGEFTAVFGAPAEPLDPPPGTYTELRRRAAARRRRRVTGVAVAVVLCAGGGAGLVALGGQDGDDASAADPLASGAGSGTEAGAGSGSSAAGPDQTEDGSPSSVGGDGAGEEEPDAEPYEARDPDGAAAPAPSGASGTGTGAPLCQSEQLELGTSGPNAGAGSIFVTLDLTNVSGETCALVGYPGVSLVGGDDGEQIGSPAERVADRESVRVELAPGETAGADLRVGRAENYSESDCSPQAARGLRVYPPEERDALFLPLEGLTGCANEDISLLDVTPVY